MTRVPLEDSPLSGSDRPAEQESGGETTPARREYEGHRLPQAERQAARSDEPDVLLDVPVLKVEEVDLTVEGELGASGRRGRGSR